MKITISNLGHQVTHDSLSALFATYGTVHTTTIAARSGRPAGHALLDMPDEAEGALAIQKLDGCIINGLAVTVEQVSLPLPG